MRAKLNAIREAIARAQCQLALLKEENAASLPNLDDLEADLDSSMRSFKEIEGQIANDPRYLHSGLRLQKPDYRPAITTDQKKKLDDLMQTLETLQIELNELKSLEQPSEREAELYFEALAAIKQTLTAVLRLKIVKSTQ
jgi:chromosome segregation ATPase